MQKTLFHFACSPMLPAMNSASCLRNFALIGCLAAVCFVPCSALAATEEGAPFGIGTRPQPSGSDLNQLLPEKVGRFTRPPFKPETKIPDDEDLTVTYSAGADRVDVGFSIAESAEDAQEGVKTTREEARAEKKPRKGEQYQIRKELSFYYLSDFVSWTRVNYFYYAKASSPAVLEEFMAKFPH
jgi:hypothetical protein